MHRTGVSVPQGDGGSEPQQPSFDRLGLLAARGYPRGMTAALPRDGDRLAGRYRIDRKLAAGGMGAVFEATDEASGAPVAIKFLHPELAGDREARRRFRREASILRALDHPAIVRVLDVGTDEVGRSYMTMERLVGETLADRLAREGPLSSEATCAIARALCGGLKAAHAHGVLHGDLKPANVFLLARPADTTAVKLVDFGTSKVHGLERLTRTGEVIGTPTYMAPELLTGTGGIDEGIDVYALGVLLYECLCGVTPFTEVNPAKLVFQIASGQGVPLAARAPHLPRSLVALVERAMAPLRADRFGDVDEVEAALATL